MREHHSLMRSFMTSDTQSVPITIRKLVKTYGPYRALDTLDLDIAGGEFLTLLGPSGSGKIDTADGHCRIPAP